MPTYAESGHHEVEDFLVAFPDGASDELLQLEEGGLGAEQGGDGSDTDFGGFSLVEDQGLDGGQELAAVDSGDRLQSEDDVRADSVGDGAALDVGNEALDSRDQVGVAQGHQSHNHLGVGLGRLEGFIGQTSILADGISLAGTQSVRVASDANQVAKSQSDGSSQFPEKNSSVTKWN